MAASLTLRAPFAKPFKQAALVAFWKWPYKSQFWIKHISTLKPPSALKVAAETRPGIERWPLGQLDWPTRKLYRLWHKPIFPIFLVLLRLTRFKLCQLSFAMESLHPKFDEISNASDGSQLHLSSSKHSIWILSTRLCPNVDFLISSSHSRWFDSN